MLRSAVCLAGSAAAVLLRSSSRCDGKPTDRCDAGNRRCCATNACAVAALAKEGFALIRCEDVSVLRSAFDESRRSDCVEASAGRFHYDLLRRRARDTALRSQIDGIVAPLRALAFEYCGRRDLYVSQLQLLDSAPGSAAQIWHLDNTRRGLTFVLPVADVELENGPTELLPRSHRALFFRDEGDAPVSFDERPPPPLRLAPLRVGEALVFDARMLHRGGANESEQHRRVLIVRFDERKYRPPGVGLVGTAVLRLVAYAWCALAPPDQTRADQ